MAIVEIMLSFCVNCNRNTDTFLYLYLLDLVFSSEKSSFCVKTRLVVFFSFGQGAYWARESSGPEDGGGAGGPGKGEEGAGAEEAGPWGEAETGEGDNFGASRGPLAEPLIRFFVSLPTRRSSRGWLQRRGLPKSGRLPGRERLQPSRWDGHSRRLIESFDKHPSDLIISLTLSMGA